MIVDIDLYAFTPSGAFDLLEVTDPGPTVLLADILDARARFQPVGAGLVGDLEIPIPAEDWGAAWGVGLGVGLEGDVLDGIATIPEEAFVVRFGLRPIDARATFGTLVIEEPVYTTAVDLKPSWERPVSRAALIDALSLAGGS